MRVKHLAASGIAALALTLWPGTSRADDAELDAELDTELVIASRPFSLGEVAIERRAETSLRVGQFDCEGCYEGTNFTLVAWDLSVTVPVANRAALFVLLPILFRSSGGARSSEDPPGKAHQFPGALTLGLRHAAPVGPELTLGTAVSVSFSAPAGGNGEVTAELASRMIDDITLYTTGGGRFRVEFDVRQRWAPLFAQAQLAVAAQADDAGLRGSSRAGVAAGVEILERAALLVELTTLLGAGQLVCKYCLDGLEREGIGRPALSAGGRVALGPWGFGARGFLPLTDTDGQEARPSVSVTIDARF